MKPNELGLMNNQLIMMDNQTIKTEEESPATEALEFLLQTEDSNSLMSDLSELLKRDQNLTVLSSNVSPVVSGVPIPISRNNTDPMMSTLNELEDTLASGPGTSNSSYGVNPGAAFGSSVGSSPSVFPQNKQVDLKFEPNVKMETDTMTLAALNNDDSSSNSLMKLELNEFGLGLDINDYYTNPASRNVSFGVQETKPIIVSKPNIWQQQPQQQQQQQNDSLLFSSSSFNSHSGGATFGNKDLLSSSVPVNIFHNSPLSDILPDFSSPNHTTSTVTSANVTSPNSSVSPNLPSHSPSHAGPERHSTLHKLLARKDPVSRPSPVRSPENKKTLERIRNSLSASNPLLSQQLSKSAPSQQTNYLDRWSRREPRQHISSVCSVGESSSIADEVSDVLDGISPTELPDIESDDEEELSQNNYDKDSSQEDDSDDDDGSSHNDSKGSGNKKDRHFWMYNVQAKGPKGQKIVLETKIEDPHVLNEIVDPVFSGDVKLQGIKHSGKARRGDGNDLTSNPKKLAAIGKELDQLNKVINDLTPVSEMPFNSRCKSRKEKNKLASRACRLKKKAQHEANKLKCHGLEEEHHDLNRAIAKAKEILSAKVDSKLNVDQISLTSQLDTEVKKILKNKVAGQTTEYVNKKIEAYMNSV